MITRAQYADVMRRAWQSKKTDPGWVRASLTDPLSDGNVVSDASKGIVWVLVGGVLGRAKNTSVAPFPDLPIFVSKPDIANGGIREVMGVDIDSIDQWAGTNYNIPPHDHGLDSGSPGYISASQISNALAIAQDPPSVYVDIHKFYYYLDRVLTEFTEATSASLLSSLPAAGYSRWVTLSFNPTTQAQTITQGNDFISDADPTSAYPTVPAGEAVLADVRIESDSTVIVQGTIWGERRALWDISGLTGVNGSGVANQVTYWNDPNTLAGDAGLTYDPATDKLNVVGNVSLNAASFGLTPTGTPAEGDLYWDATYKTLSLKLTGTAATGQVLQNSLVLAVNKTGSTLTKGSVVYVNGAQGNRPTIDLASATSATTSAKTLGLVMIDIADNNQGYVVSRGPIYNVNTNAYTEGDVLYISTTAGALTNVQPVAPNHSVVIGVVITKSATVGVIQVSVQNGTDMASLHDVSLSGLANNDYLYYDSATSLWKNSTLAAGSIVTGSLTSGRVPYATGATTLADSSLMTFSNSGDLLTLMAGAATDTPLKLVGASSQSADYFQAVDSTGDVLAEILSNGTLIGRISVIGRRYGASGSIVGSRFNGTYASPSKVLSGQSIATWQSQVYHGGGAAATGGSGFEAIAAEDQESGARGQFVRIFTTPVGSTTAANRVFITPSGNFGIGTLTEAGTSATKTFYQQTGVAPTAGLTDAIQMYSADYAAGDAGLFVRPEIIGPTLHKFASLYEIDKTDAVTNATSTLNILDHKSSGTAAAGFGTLTAYKLQSSTTASQSALDLAVTWATATHASRKARVVLSVYDTAAREIMRGEADGSNPMIGFLGATAVTRPTALTTKLTSITHTSPGTPDYAIQNLTNIAGYGFVTQDEGNTVLSVILNLQTRVNELETKLQALGLLS